MEDKHRINLDVFKVVCKAVSQSHSLDTMLGQLTQLLVGALQIKGCTIFALNQNTNELEILASFGLSPSYLSKGPILADRGLCALLEGKPIIVRDVSADDRLQYPEEAKKEGIGAIVSICIPFSGRTIGGLRLYHHSPWDISDQDLDYLLILAEHLGLAMMFEVAVGALRNVNESISRLPDELKPFVSSH